MPREERSIRDLLIAQATRAPDAIALAAPGRAPLTYGRLAAQIDYVTCALRDMGLKGTARVAVVLEQGAETAVASIAVAAAASCAPLNPAYRSAEYDWCLEHLEIGAVVVRRGVESEVEAVAARHGIPVIELNPSEDEETGLFVLRGPDGRRPFPAPARDADEIALLLSTSGTTSRPKIVPLTQANVCTSALSMGRTLGLRDSDRCLNVMPLFHIHGLMVTLASLAAGGSTVCAPTLDVRQFFELLEEFSPTWYSAVPTVHLSILARAAQHSETIRRRPLRFIRSSSSALAATTAVNLEEVFAVPVIEAYGMTEAAHQIATNPLPPRARKFGSVGLAAGPEVAVVDEAGTRLPRGERGEIVIRGPSVMSGYEGDPHVNAAAFINGWFRTGDEGFIDEDGYIFISGRLKEIINRGGQKVAPREVDEVLMRHPAVAQAVTFPMPHLTLGEEVAAAVVLQEDTVAGEGELREFVRERLAAYKVPRRIVLVGEIPRGATGKLQRLGLADRLGVAAGNLGPAEEKRPRDPLEHELVHIWEDVLGVRPIGIADDFFELGGHSLLAAEMIARVEQACNCRLPLGTLFRGATVEHLATVLREQTFLVEERPLFVEIQRRGSRPPLFFLHGDFGGGGLYCLKLARFLGEDQPFYALSPHGLDGEPAPQSIDAMAAAHLQMLRAAHPSGPYVLGGHCNGALVAWEMARRLRAAGEAVDLLILIEPLRPHNTRLDLRLLHGIVATESRLRGLDPDQCMARFLRLKEWSRRVRAVMPGRSARGRSDGFQPPAIPASALKMLVDRWKYLSAHYRRAAEGYLPRPYSGRVLIVWAREYLEQSRIDPTSPWRRLASDLTVQVVPGGHLTMLTEHAQSLAECLASCLGRSQLRPG